MFPVSNRWKATTLEEIRKHDHVLTPGRYVGAAMQQQEAKRLDALIEHNLQNLGFCLEGMS